ncbi:hypothetical protein O181_091331 [Austropuccinia psidii MF-1]|uniref:Uncharacterized protein n=1 Tax=Austropuccinia psidii MF-1 TaxID=1389203 RepID=A0A9Q3P9K3_9BASI|nr:hypothetical protein [Austropuccinia psidii MF-1]
MVVQGQKWVLRDLWPKWIQGVFGPIWVQGIGGQKWLRWAQLWFGTHLALGARWLPPLAPFGLIGLGQKGPNPPTDRGLRTVRTAYYGPRTVEAVGGLNGPKRPFRPKPP